MERATSVRIDQQALRALAADLGPIMHQAPDWHDPRHFTEGTWLTAGWVLVLDAHKFCFWSQAGARWQVEWQGRIENGYWALAAALSRAVREGRPLWDPGYLGELTPRDVAHILRPHEDGAPEIPLFPLRVQNLHELARGLREGFPDAEIPVQALIEAADGSAIDLVRAVTSRFPSFNDVASFQDQEVRFYKRAQILVADLAAAFDGSGLGAFHDLNQLTAFADYKIPQVLRGFKAMVYTDDLAEAIAAHRLIPTGSAWEIEIRSATIWACELLRQILAEEGRLHRATEIDAILWLAGQSLPAEMPPYHRTLTVFY
jgi:hypothetical protein